METGPHHLPATDGSPYVGRINFVRVPRVRIVNGDIRPQNGLCGGHTSNANYTWKYDQCFIFRCGFKAIETPPSQSHTLYFFKLILPIWSYNNNNTINKMRIKVLGDWDNYQPVYVKEFYDETPGTTAPNAEDMFTTTTLSWHHYMWSGTSSIARGEMWMMNNQPNSIYVGPAQNQIEWMVYQYI